MNTKTIITGGLVSLLAINNVAKLVVIRDLDRKIATDEQVATAVIEKPAEEVIHTDMITEELPWVQDLKEADVLVEGECPNGLHYTLYTSGLMTITGKGEMADTANTAPWADYRYEIRSVVIEEGITSVGSHAFADYPTLLSVQIPNTVTRIGDNAFSGCTALTSVTLPEAVDTIGYRAFFGCYNLAEINLPSHVSFIDMGAFGSCTSLTTVVIPDGVEKIADSTFMNCTSLSSVRIPASVKEISFSAFRNCGALTSVEIPASVEKFNNYAFARSGITSITINEGAALIGAYCFDTCRDLQSVSIPHSVTEIGTGCFDECQNLKDIYYAGTQEEWDALNVIVPEGTVVHTN